MIKNKTISKTKLKKELVKILPGENRQLQSKFLESLELIKEANAEITKLRNEITEQNKLIDILKSNWTYKLRTFLKFIVK